MLSAELGPIMFLIVVNIILLIGGQFMEPSGLLVIVAPLVFPIAMELGMGLEVIIALGLLERLAELAEPLNGR